MEVGNQEPQLCDMVTFMESGGDGCQLKGVACEGVKQQLAAAGK